MKIIISLSGEDDEKLVDLDSRDAPEEEGATSDTEDSADALQDSADDESEAEESGDAAEATSDDEEAPADADSDSPAEDEAEDTPAEGDAEAPDEDPDAAAEDAEAPADGEEGDGTSEGAGDADAEADAPAEDDKAGKKAPAKAKAPVDDRRPANDVRLPDNGPTVIKKPSNPVFFNTNNNDLIRKRGLAFLGSYLINTPSVGSLQRVTYADNPEGAYVIVVYGSEAVRVPYNDISATDAFADTASFLAFLRSYGALPAIFRKKEKAKVAETAKEESDTPAPAANIPVSPTSRQEIKDDLDVANADK